jgi:hypothetical protein
MSSDHDTLPSPLSSDSIISADETHRRIASYSRRYKLGELRRRAEAKHERVATAGIRLAKAARGMLLNAYDAGCLLVALRSKCQRDGERFLTTDKRLVEGTEITRTTAYRYISLAEHWHLLGGGAEQIWSINQALATIEQEKQRLAADAEMDALVAMDDDEQQVVDAHHGQIGAPQANGRRGGRPRAGTAERIRGRIASLVSQVESDLYDNPRSIVMELSHAIDRLGRLRDEAQAVIDEEERGAA